MDATRILFLASAINAQLEKILIYVNYVKENLNNHIHLSKLEILKMPQSNWFVNMETSKNKRNLNYKIK